MMAETVVAVPGRATGEITRDGAGRHRADPSGVPGSAGRDGGRDAAMVAELHAALADLHERLDGLCHEHDMSVARRADGAMSPRDARASCPSEELGRRIAETRARIAEVRSALEGMASRNDGIPGDR